MGIFDKEPNRMVQSEFDEGMFGGSPQASQDEIARARQRAFDANNRTVTPMDLARYDSQTQNMDQARSEQLGALGMMHKQAMGQGPSVAQNMYRQNSAAALAGQQSLAAGARGGGANAAFAQMQAARQGGQMGLQAANQSAMIRQQEMLNAQNGYMQGSSALRATDLGAAQQAQDLATKQKSFEMMQNQMNDALSQYYEDKASNVLGANQNASLSLTGVRHGVQTANAAQSSQDSSRGMSALLTALSAAGMIAVASDRRAKTDIEPGEESVRETLRALVPYVYRYKDEEKHGKGARAGIMAQDLEKTDRGRELVVKHSSGVKMIDVNKGISLSLAGLADLAKRVDGLERRKAG